MCLCVRCIICDDVCHSETDVIFVLVHFLYHFVLYYSLILFFLLSVTPGFSFHIACFYLSRALFRFVYILYSQVDMEDEIYGTLNDIEEDIYGEIINTGQKHPKLSSSSSRGPRSPVGV